MDGFDEKTNQVTTKSSMKTENRSGPRIDPWGTDAWFGNGSDECPENTKFD